MRESLGSQIVRKTPDDSTHLIMTWIIELLGSVLIVLNLLAEAFTGQNLAHSVGRGIDVMVLLRNIETLVEAVRETGSCTRFSVTGGKIVKHVPHSKCIA